MVDIFTWDAVDTVGAPSLGTPLLIGHGRRCRDCLDDDSETEIMAKTEARTEAKVDTPTKICYVSEHAPLFPQRCVWFPGINLLFIL